MKFKMFIFYGILILLAFWGLYRIGQNNREKKQVISEKGVESVATVINRSITRNPNMFERYTVKFDFEIDGKLVQSYNRFSEKWYYENAIIGMKYKVKHLTIKPQQNAEIYIDKPIKSEYANIEKERERILNTYKDANVSLKKNARPLDKIQHLIP